MNGGEAESKKKLDFWQSKTGRKLTDEDNRQIRESLTGFFEILREWQQKEGGHVH